MCQKIELMRGGGGLDIFSITGFKSIFWDPRLSLRRDMFMEGRPVAAKQRTLSTCSKQRWNMTSNSISSHMASIAIMDVQCSAGIWCIGAIAEEKHTS